MKKQKFKKIAKILIVTYKIFGIVFVLISFFLIGLPLAPTIYYQLNTSAAESDLHLISEPLSQNLSPDYLEELKQARERQKLPPIDTTLPKTNMIQIQSIGVDGEIHESTDPKQGLDQGLWRVNNFGNPLENEIPIIIAAHRFGDVRWSNDFRITNTFYNLPETRIGDRIIIIWDQRKFVYEITEAFDNTYINNYNIDLILYTCRLYSSPVRVFRYAKRVIEE